mgnify:CR=1 FL=1|jgi:hypothetical protein
MTLSWKELVCHGLLAKIEEPEVVKLCLKMVMKERCAYLSEEAREFHSEPRRQELARISARGGTIALLEQVSPRLRHQINTVHPLWKIPSLHRQKCLEIDAAISRDKLIDELKSSWKKIIKNYRKKRRERRYNNLRCGCCSIDKKGICVMQFIEPQYRSDAIIVEPTTMLVSEHRSTGARRYKLT